MTMLDLQAARDGIREALLADCIYLHPVTLGHLPECRQGDVDPVHIWMREGEQYTADNPPPWINRHRNEG